MSTGKAGSMLLRCITANTTLAVVGLAAAAVAVTALPARERADVTTDPTADARAAYRALMDQLEESETTPKGAILGSAGLSGSIDSRRRELRLSRDFFSPLSARASGARFGRNASDGAQDRSLPSLQGIYMDGHSRYAVIAGSVVTIGDDVRGYKVIAITPEQVVLAKGASRKTLALGGKR